MALTDRGHNSGNASNPGRDDPRGQVADIDDLHESVGGRRRENTTAASQPSRPVPESVARDTGYNDQSGPRDEEPVADTGSAGSLSGHLRLCIVGRVLRLGTLSQLDRLSCVDRLSCLDSSGLIIPSVRGYPRHHGSVARTVGLNEVHALRYRAVPPGTTARSMPEVNAIRVLPSSRFAIGKGLGPERYSPAPPFRHCPRSSW